MTYAGAIVVFIILIALVAGLMAGPLYLYRERPRPSGTGPARRETYGPPPGAYRALHHEELAERGWPEFPFEYSATTASAISHMIERSA